MTLPNRKLNIKLLLSIAIIILRGQRVDVNISLKQCFQKACTIAKHLNKQ
jgi:hypothetical protein